MIPNQLHFQITQLTDGAIPAREFVSWFRDHRADIFADPATTPYGYAVETVIMEYFDHGDPTDHELRDDFPADIAMAWDTATRRNTFADDAA